MVNMNDVILYGILSVISIFIFFWWFFDTKMKVDNDEGWKSALGVTIILVGLTVFFWFELLFVYDVIVSWLWTNPTRYFGGITITFGFLIMLDSIKLFPKGDKE